MYRRSVLFRFAGVLAGMSLWTGLIVYALINLDSEQGLPNSLEVTWPYWFVAVAITLGVFLVRRRLGAGPGWGAFVIGVIAPFVGLLLNANFGGGIWFWVPVLVLVLVPLATSDDEEVPESS